MFAKNQTVTQKDGEYPSTNISHELLYYSSILNKLWRTHLLWTENGKVSADFLKLTKALSCIEQNYVRAVWRFVTDELVIYSSFALIYAYLTINRIEIKMEPRISWTLLNPHTILSFTKTNYKNIQTSLEYNEEKKPKILASSSLKN